MKKRLLTLLLAASCAYANAQTVAVEKWLNGKKSATVITFDDWSPGHGGVAVPILVEKEVPGTFFVTTGNSFAGGGYAQMNYAAENGMEIANHTITHRNLSTLTDADKEQEINGAKDIIEANVPSQGEVMTYCYPRGDYDQSVLDKVMEKHIAGRKFIEGYDKTFTYDFAQTEQDYFTIQQIQLNTSVTPAQYIGWMDHAIQNNAMMVYTFHSVSSATVNDSWFDEVPDTYLSTFVDDIKTYENDTWFATFADAVRYHKEANSATVSTVSNTTDFLTLRLSDTLSNNAIYNIPLTLRLTQEVGESYSSVTQNGQILPITIEGNDIIFNAIPDGGDIVVNKSGILLSVASPVAGTVFNDLSPITLQASASTSNGTIASVVFNVDGQNLNATLNGGLYEATWTPSNYNNYAIAVTATASTGKSTNTSINVSVEVPPLCDKPEWNSSAQYTGGAIVSYEGNEYKAKWWSQGNTPTAGDPWEYIGPCGGGDQNQAPTVSFSAPANGSSFEGLNAITFSVNANDVDGTVSKVVYIVGGITYDVTSAPFNLEWTPTTYGTVSVSAVAVDNDNASSTSSSISVTTTEPQGNQAPTVAFTAPANGSSFEGLNTITFSVNANDVDGTVSKVVYTVGGTTYDVTSAPFDLVWTPTTYGTVSVSVVAIDNENESSTSSSTSVNVIEDVNALPTVSITSPSNNATIYGLGAIQITTSANDTDGSIANVAITVDGQTTNGTSLSWTPSAYGNYTIIAVATDNEGGVSTIASISVTVEEEQVNTCSDPAWSASTSYGGGSIVSHNNHTWKAKWWTLNEEPGTTGQWGVWEDLGACSAARLAVVSEVVTLSVYPNPAQDILSISTEVESVQIIDAQGQVVLTANNVSEVNVADLAGGLYIVLLVDGENVEKISLVKE